MERLPLIDLIIPVYNRQDTIPALIRTLDNQNFRSFRAIFVDDGSQDDSYEVLKDQLKGASFQYLLLRQENKGPSSARNFGAKNAEAKWVCFTDSDDILKPEYLEYLFQAVDGTNAQMGFCQLEMIPEHSEKMPQPAGVLNVQMMTACEAMQEHYSSWIAPVCLILNREWMAKNDLHFDEDCRYCEDLMFITECIAAARTVCKINNSLYVYCTHEGSLLRSADTKKYLNGLEGFGRLEKTLQNHTSDAVRVFASVGRARFILGILRRGALQMTPAAFRELCCVAQYDKCHWQISSLPIKQRIAGYMYMISPMFFYRVSRLMYKD